MSRRPSQPRGFTLIELMVVVSIVAVLGAIGVFIARYGTRNASVSGSAYELAIRLQGLRAQALSEGVDYFAVVLDAAGNDATSCGVFDRHHCTQFIVLRTLPPGFTLASFDPGALAGIGSEDWRTLPRTIKFLTPSTQVAYPKAPFTGVNVNDAGILQICASARKCLMLQFSRNGDVRAVTTPSAGTAARIDNKNGVAFVLSNDIPQEKGGQQAGVLISFPTGIVRSFPW